MPPICVQGFWLHKSIGHPCPHGKPNPAPEPTGRWHVHLEDDIYLLYNCWIWVFLEVNEQWPSLCDWISPSSKDFLEAVTHQLCGSLGSAPRWVEKDNPLGTPPHPTAPRKLRVPFDHKLAALAMPARPCGQYQMFSQDVWRSCIPSSQGHRAGQCAGNCSRTLGTHCFLLAQHREHCRGQILQEQQEGHKQSQARSVGLHPPLCQLLKSFIHMSDGSAWSLQIPGASLKHGAWVRKGLVFATSHSPRDRRSSMGARRMGKSSLFNPLIITVSSNLLNTCLFCTKVGKGRQQRFTTVCLDCVNSPNMIQKPKLQWIVCFLATLFHWWREYLHTNWLELLQWVNWCSYVLQVLKAE